MSGGIPGLVGAIKLIPVWVKYSTIFNIRKIWPLTPSPSKVTMDAAFLFSSNLTTFKLLWDVHSVSVAICVSTGHRKSSAILVILGELGVR